MSHTVPHPIVAAAARGELPSWTEAGPSRRAHMERVARLMRTWAQELGESPAEADRWAAAGWLHDALREADPETLRPMLGPDLHDLPGAVLHGPAAAILLGREGVEDRSLLLAVAFHTLGHPDFDRLGKALSAADFLEPGRTSLADLRDPLRARMPQELEPVLKDIMAARIRNLIHRGHPISAYTMRCWNRIVGHHD